MTSPEHNPTDPPCQCDLCLRGWLSDNLIESMPLPEPVYIALFDALFDATGIDCREEPDREAWLGDALDAAPVSSLSEAWRITLSQGEEAAP